LTRWPCSRSTLLIVPALDFIFAGFDLAGRDGLDAASAMAPSWHMQVGDLISCTHSMCRGALICGSDWGLAQQKYCLLLDWWHAVAASSARSC
jgi:hypothetical protein